MKNHAPLGTPRARRASVSATSTTVKIVIATTIAASTNNSFVIDRFYVSSLNLD